MKGHHLYIPEHEIIFLEKPQHEFCFIQLKKQVNEKRVTVGTHKNADYLLKNMSTKHNNFFLMMSVSNNFLLESECFITIRFLPSQT